MSWSETADAAQRVLADRFWHPRFGIYQDVPGRRRFAMRLPWDYWIQAHALDVSVDAAARTGSTGLRDRVRAHVAGILRRNGGRIVNRYYDDMAWMGIALLRADEVAAPTPVGWSGSCGPTSAPAGTRSTAASSGAVTTPGRTRTRRPTLPRDPGRAPAPALPRPGGPGLGPPYRRLAAGHARRPGSGIVWDGPHPAEDAGPDRTLWTYNQGTVVGAEVELWRVTGDRAHLERARKTATAAVDTSPTRSAACSWSKAAATLRCSREYSPGISAIW